MKIIREWHDGFMIDTGNGCIEIFTNADGEHRLGAIRHFALLTDDVIKDADLVITGEGRLDVQSSGGKAVQGVAERAKRAGIPCMAICGCLGSGYELIKESGIADIVTLTDENTSPEYAMQHAERV